MDSFELNKIAGAVLFAVFMVFGLNFLADFMFAPGHPEKPGFVIEVAGSDDGHGGGEAKEEAPAEESVLSMIGGADPAAGQKVAKKCAACHTFDNGGANKVGPNLWNVVNRKPASMADFKYSGALSEFSATTNWTFEALDVFLSNPKSAIPGNKMSFAGVKKTADRAAVLAYLRSLSDSPADLPAAEEPAKEASAGETPAAEEPAKETSAGETPAAEEPAGEETKTE